MSRIITFIGMGEAGSAFVQGWGKGIDARIRAYDIKSDDPATAGEMRERYAGLGIEGCSSAAEAVAGAQVVLCTVTADQAVRAAETAAPYLDEGAFWCDLNSCAPSSKQRSAGIIEARGGRYVDVAVMSPVHPKLNMTPLLLSGPHAQAIAPVLEALPTSLRVVEGPVGAASSIKMIRSVMIKGMEALTAECLLACVAAGVDGEVLASLGKSNPQIDWPAQTAYNLERMMVHGARRAAEMEEVARTLADLGLPNGMASATVEWQRRLAGQGLPAPDLADTDGPAMARRLLPCVRGDGGA